MTYDEIKEVIVSASRNIRDNTILLQDGVRLLDNMEDELTSEGQNILAWLLKYTDEQDRLNDRYRHIIEGFGSE